MRAAIVLAAGRSERFGRVDKLFVQFREAPLVLHAIRAARAAPVVRVIVVAGRGAVRLRALLRQRGWRDVHMVRAKRGAPMSASLATAIRALRPVERDAFLFLGDMPLVSTETAARLLRASRPGVAVVRPHWRGVPGHPVFVRRIRSVPLRAGDAGLRPAPGTVAAIPGGRSNILDIDSPAALARARRAALLRPGRSPIETATAGRRKSRWVSSGET